MICFVSLGWWVLHPSAALASASAHVATRRRQSHARTQTLAHTNCIQKITSLPRRCLKITSVPHHSTNHSPGLLPPPPPPPSPCLTILGFFLHFNSALNCQAWIALWTAWGGQAGRRCVWMRESLLSPSLFIFLSKWCCQEPNKISLSARPPTESHNTTSRKWNKKE